MPFARKNIYSVSMVVAAALLAAACSSKRTEPAPVVYRTPAQPAPNTATTEARPSAAPSSAPAPAPAGQADERGIVYYEGYETIRARSGDSVESMAARAGVSGSELAAYNGLSTQYVPREGDELVLPARPDHYQGGVVVAAASTETGTTTTDVPADSDGGWSADATRAAIGDEGSSTSAVTEETLAPPMADEAAPEQPAETTTAMAPETPAAPPPPANPVAGPSGFVRPVGAAVSRPFSRTPGPDRNDGVDFATAAGDPVHAAGAGTVALISQSLGGLGTIVLIRHDNDYLTVYGRVADVTVKKGDRVESGQVIARVADLAPPQGPSLHYEVRRGAESIDPTPYL